MIEPLERVRVQIDEITRNMDADDMAPVPFVDRPEHEPFDQDGAAVR